MNFSPIAISDTTCLNCAATIGSGLSRKRKRNELRKPRVKYLIYEDGDTQTTLHTTNTSSSGLRPRKEASAAKANPRNDYNIISCNVRVPAVITIPEAIQLVFNLDLNVVNRASAGLQNFEDLAFCEDCADVMTQLYKLHKKLHRLTSDLSFLAAILKMKTADDNNVHQEQSVLREVPFHEPAPRAPSLALVTSSEFEPTTIQMFEVNQEGGDGDGVLNVVEYSCPIQLKEEEEEEEEIEINDNDDGSYSDPEFEGYKTDADANASDGESDDTASSISIPRKTRKNKNRKPRTREKRAKLKPSKQASTSKPRVLVLGGSDPILSVICSICGKPYKHFRDAREHIVKHFGPEEERHENILKCGRCRFVFLGQESFDVHDNDCREGRRSIGYDYRRIACLDCDNRIGGNSSLGSIFQGQQIPVACNLHSSSFCEICGRCRRSGRGGHESHCWSHLGPEEKDAVPKSYLCPHCARTFPLEYHLEKHIYRQHGPNAGKPQKKKPVVKSTGMAAIRYKCPKCDDTFTLKGSMQTHLKVHELNEGRTFPCPACSQVFDLPHKLSDHKRRCDGFANARPYQCDTCAKRYRTRKELNKHVAGVHLGKRRKKKYVPVADPSRRKGRWKVMPVP